MYAIETILCPVDFSEFSQRAVRYGAAFAAEYNARLIVLHVVPNVSDAAFPDRIPVVSSPLIEERSKQMEEFAEHHIPPGVRLEKRVKAGAAVSSILEVATAESAELIVMGTHGTSGYKQFFTGSTTHTVLDRSETPVLTVCNPTRHIYPDMTYVAIKLKRILCAVDPEHENLRMAQLAMSIARTYASNIIFVEVKTSEQTRRNEPSTMDFLKELIRPEDELWSTVQLQQTTGDAPDEILRTIRSREIDLVIMGHEARKPMVVGALRSVAMQVVTQSECPVLVMRNKNH
jgi:nucleotide-binding universal stress UspA family protein